MDETAEDPLSNKSWLIAPFKRTRLSEREL